MRPMISVAATTGLLEAIGSAGADPDQVLRALELDRAVLSKTKALSPVPRLRGF